MTVTLMNMKACSYLYKQTPERRSHFAVVAKFLDENVALKLNLHCFKLHCPYSVSFNLSNVGKIFWGMNLKGLYLSLERFKENVCFVHVLHKVGVCN